MRLLNSEEMAKRTGAPYRSLLDWITAGYFEPRYISGKVRRTAVFDEANLEEIKCFVRARRHFSPEQWKALALVIRKARDEQMHRFYIVEVVRPEDGEGELNIATDDEARDLLDEERVRVIVPMRTQEVRTTG